MRRTIGIMAHVDAGKTTLSEQVLTHAGVLRKAGRVDHADAFLDLDPIERARGITIFSDQAYFDRSGMRVYWLDTPGHVDFSAEAERALLAMDAAVLVVSGVEGVESHTVSLWRLLKKYGIPVFFFVNKMDREGADIARTLAEIRRLLTPDAVCLDEMAADGTLPAQLAEEMAEREEGLIERYLSGGYDAAAWLAAMRKMIASRRIFPLLSGSALLDQGVARFLDALVLLTAWPDAWKEDAPFSARVYKVRHDAQGVRVVYLKCLAGTLRPRQTVDCPSPGGLCAEKINELRLYAGAKYQQTADARAGDLVAVTGLTQVHAGDIVGAGAMRGNFAVCPVFSSMVVSKDECPMRELTAIFRRLEDEDPQLLVEWDEQLAMLSVAVMGQIQLEILSEVIKARFQRVVEFSPCRIRYRETIASPVVGVGHYEPLRHYAEVHLGLYPAPRGSGITFESRCHVDDLPAAFQNLICTHVHEKDHRGVLIGAPLTDVHVVLLSGRDHPKHTEGGDFRQATYRAIRQGLMQADSVLLEPLVAFVLRAPEEATGRLLGALSTTEAVYDTPCTAAGETEICGEMTAAHMMEFAEDVPRLTRGRGAVEYHFSRYAPVKNAAEIIAQTDYHPTADAENTPDSVFCQKGAGFIVTWNHVFDFAHLPVESVKGGMESDGDMAALCGSENADRRQSGKDRI